MDIKRAMMMIVTVPSLLMMAAAPCSAARIYNETTTAIKVDGTLFSQNMEGIGGPIDPGAVNRGLSPDKGVTLNPGGKSESLNWTSSMGVVVRDQEDTLLCQVGFGFHYQIQGGNYLLISQHGQKVNCMVCSNHQVIDSSQGLMKKGSTAHISPHQKCS